MKWLGYVTPVAPGGGGTVVLAGSHRLAAHWARHAPAGDPGRSRTVRDGVFGSAPWFGNLRRAGEPDAHRALVEGAVVDGVPVRAVELTGEPGDVVFLHPHLLHAAAPNRADRPRFMVTGQVIGYG